MSFDKVNHREFLDEITPFRLLEGYLGDGTYVFSNIRDVPKIPQYLEVMRTKGIKRTDIELDLVDIRNEDGTLSPKLDSSLVFMFSLDARYYISPEGSVVRTKYTFAGRYESAGFYIEDLLESKSKSIVDLESGPTGI